ncbi:MAG: penicillin amidase [Acetobacteraceae bacterium]|nr:penicillin amidase [Acetobacteraceae bacterium]
MQLDDAALIIALRGTQPVETICRATGVSLAEFEVARDAYLRRSAILGDRTVTGPVSGLVEIKRDRAGVPHIYADHTSDLFFGLGVAMAQDRLWQMDRLRRRGLGRQAEILGSDYLASDIAHLTVGIDQIAERDARAMDPATRRIVDAFVAGINCQIAAARTSLPIEFQLLDYQPEDFTARDIVAIGRGIWWSLNGRIDRLAAAEAACMLPTEALRMLYLTPEASENLVVPPSPRGTGGDAWPAGTDDATGSNNWALDGAHTASGHPVLCGDPHQPFWVPSSWYEFSLHGPEDHAAGAGHPGLPGLWWGSNGTTAWGITNNAASTRDLYREELHPSDALRYREGEAWLSFSERQVTIQVRNAAPHHLVIRSTIRGPVVNDLITPVAPNGDPPLSLRWVGAEHLDDMRAMIAVSRGRDWQGFRTALRDWAIAVFNFVYADRDGNIGYQMAGRIPRRGRITHGFRDAGVAADEWQGSVPFDDLPHSYNPARGYVASANQRIVAPDDRRPIYGAFSQGHRGVRIDQAFAAESAMDRAANIRLQNDTKSCRAERLCPYILRYLTGSADPDVAIVAGALAGWDHRYDLTSTAPTLFETFMTQWQRMVLAVHLPARLLDLTSQQTGLAASLLEGAEPRYFATGTADAVLAAAKSTIAKLRERLGNEPATWRWERLHIAHWRHPLSTPALGAALDIGPAPVDGGSHTIRNTGGELPPHGANSGAEYRIVADFTIPDSFLAVQNIGNSGVPGSPHYSDQFEPWLRGDYHVVHLNRADVEQNCTTTTRIIRSHS